MAYRDIKFGGDFEAWLDSKLSKIKTEASDKFQRVRDFVNLEDSKLRANSFGSDTSYGALQQAEHLHAPDIDHDCETRDTTGGEVDYGELVGDGHYDGPGKLASSLEQYDNDENQYEVEEDWTWDNLTTERMSRSKSTSNGGGYGGGGSIYTTVFMDDDAMPAEEYPQTPSARETVAKILQETELKDSNAMKGQNRVIHQFNFEPEESSYRDTRGRSDDYEDFDDNWSLEDEPAVTLDPSKLTYRHLRESGDGGEDTSNHRSQHSNQIYRPNSLPLRGRGGSVGQEGLLDGGRDVEGAVEVEEFTDAVEDLSLPEVRGQTEAEDADLDIKTPTGKGRALLPMLEDLELSYSDNSDSDENILDREDVATITLPSFSDTAPIIMDEGELQQRMLKRRKKIRIGVITFSVVMAVTGFALVVYLTVHLLMT